MNTQMPNSQFLIEARPKFQLLSVDQIKQIHLASLEILEKTGVEVLLAEARDLLKNAGAHIIDEKKVKIPSFLVEEALRHAPSRITISDRNGKPVMFLEADNSYFGPGTDARFIIDPYTGDRRSTTGNDVEKVARLCDALPNIDFVASMGGMSAKECDPFLSDRHNFYRMISNTTKPILFTAWSLEGLSAIYDMSVEISGSAERFKNNPFIILYAEPITPLQHPSQSLEKLLFCAEKGIPVAYVSAPIMGATSPATLAGNIILQNAEFLSGLVIAQLKQKRAPVIYGGGGTPMDMKTSVNIFNGPEAFIVHVADKEIASFYDLPDFNTGGCSDAKELDQQAGAESALSLLQAGMVGSNLVHDVGYLESGLTTSWEMIVMANELIDQIRHMLKGMSINDETLAIGVIDKVGPGGNFLQEDHTYNHFRDIWYPEVFDRSRLDTWVQNGSKSLDSVLREKVKSTLESHESEPLSVEIRSALEGILELKL